MLWSVKKATFEQAIRASAGCFRRQRSRALWKEMLALCRSLKSPEGKHRHCVYHQSNNRKAKKRNRKPENTEIRNQEVWRAGAKCAARAGPTALLGCTDRLRKCADPVSILKGGVYELSTEMR